MRYNTMILLVLSISLLLVLTAVLFARLQSREMPQSSENSVLDRTLRSEDFPSVPLEDFSG